MNALVLPYPEIDPVLIAFGPVAIRWYALAYILGLVLGWFYVVALIRRPALWGAGGAPASKQDIDDLLLWAALGVVLGGRIGYVLFYNFEYYLADPAAALAVWRGGMSFHGGMLGVAVALALFCWHRHRPLLRVADAVACATPIGLFFGRLANFINGELYGRVSDVPWAMVFPDGGPLPRHPSQLYEAALEGALLFAVLALLVWRAHALQRPGLCTGVFLAGYGLARMIAEQFRQPDAQIGFVAGGLTLGLLLSLPMVIVGLALIWHGLRARPEMRKA